MIKYGMILAAGLGKRMQPLTLKTPKPLLEINNISLLERTINLLIKSGVEEISINSFGSVVKTQQLSSSAPSGEVHLLQIPPNQKVS